MEHHFHKTDVEKERHFVMRRYAILAVLSFVFSVVYCTQLFSAFFFFL